MKKLLVVLSASIGMGHVKAAQAVIKQVKLKNKNLEIRHIDLLSLMPDFLTNIGLKAYCWCLACMPIIYGWVYARSDHAGNNWLNLWLYRFLAIKLRQMLPVCPDYVICTHILGAGAMDYWNRNWGRMEYSCCVTDFVIHKNWLYKTASAYFIDNAEQRQKLIQEGIAIERCFLYGIPHDQPTGLNKLAARKNLGIAMEEKLVFIFGGGWGMLSMKLEMLIDTKKNYRYVICCGNNQQLAAKLRVRLAKYNCMILGFCDNISSWLLAADVVVTKAGGISLSEIFSAGTDCIIYKPFAGQEGQNALYCQKNKLAEVVFDEAECKKIIDKRLTIASNEDINLEARLKCKANPAEKIAKHIIDELYK